MPTWPSSVCRSTRGPWAVPALDGRPPAKRHLVCISWANEREVGHHAQGRQVFDGLIPTIAGGGQGFFNHRFASPTRTATQHGGHLYPADVFPFPYGDETDPFTGRTDGLLRRARAVGHTDAPVEILIADMVIQ